ncbi:MAG: DUF2231 domain-containing protein [Parvibaculaceae bacterium]
MVIDIIPNWHPIIVHFTVALLSIAATLFIAEPFIAHPGIRRQIATVARWNLWFGAGAAILTVIAGFLAFDAVPHSSETQHQAMIDHRNWALATAALFVTLAGWSLVQTLRGSLELRGWQRAVFIPLIAGAALMLLVTGFKGGELVYRHGLGVMSAQANQAGAAGGHAHGAGESHAMETEPMETMPGHSHQSGAAHDEEESEHGMEGGSHGH